MNGIVELATKIQSERSGNSRLVMFHNLDTGVAPLLCCLGDSKDCDVRAMGRNCVQVLYIQMITVNVSDHNRYYIACVPEFWRKLAWIDNKLFPLLFQYYASMAILS